MPVHDRRAGARAERSARRAVPTGTPVTVRLTRARVLLRLQLARGYWLP
ncbi:hypothetical protein H1V43_07145 [Streptomyces sp. PSKA54]|uniref:Uncharacterized protein n=1 Tax=Streptomyces himalayensis subsp. aureolus TaxID=2758039 RepID=A0A7W2CY87_9ACTN|nr:hypothetical protein [Streptomyces himalayensis]MBA4861161.1 hypothetical protein [Streptomyces himalayensis subsp. aureolus]